jgi:dolichyl-phosphate-mannose--protein O-mannosyl transferase
MVLLAVLELASVSSGRLTMGVSTSIFFLGYGAALLVCAWAVYRLVSWARSPIVLAQLIQLGVAWSFRGGGTTVLAIGLAVVALVVLAGVLHPASLDALSDEPAS